MTSKWLSLFMALVMSSMLVSPLASGADGSEAKEHFLKGKSFMEQGALHEAIEEFEQSYALNPVPIVLYNIAICWDLLEDYVEAENFYSRYLNESSGLTDERKAEVQERLDYISGFIGLLNIVDADEGAEIWIDGELVGKTPLADIVLATGEHGLVLKAPGLPDFEESFTIAAGQVTTVVVSIPDAEVPPPEKVDEGAVEDIEAGAESGDEQAVADETDPASDFLVLEDVTQRKKLAKTPFIVVASISGVVLGSAIVTGSLAWSTHREFETKYREDESEWKPLKKRSDALAVTTDVLIGIGAAAAAAAVMLGIFTDWKGEQEMQGAEGAEGVASSRFLTLPLASPYAAGFMVQGKF